MSSMEQKIDNWNRLKFDLGTQVLSYLENPNVVEIMVNDDNSLWVEEHGVPMQCVGELTSEKTKMIINTVAHSLNTIVDSKNPILSGELPIDGSRFQGMVPPVVKAPVICIRKKATKVYTLDEYVESKTITYNQRKLISRLCDERRNFLIVGSTGSGKTTFANAILHEIAILDPHCRMAIIEDTQELQCNIQNRIITRTSDEVTMQDLLKSMMRFRPDRICVGEVRGIEVYSMLMAWNTGHSGGITTIHANNARAGIKRIEQILSLHKYDPIPSVIAESIHVIISIQKTPLGRRVNEILELSESNGEYIFKEIV